MPSKFFSKIRKIIVASDYYKRYNKLNKEGGFSFMKREPIDNDYKEFGERLRNLRKSRGYTLQDVSKIIGLAPNTIGEYECGQKRANLSIMKKFCEFYAVSSDELLDITSSNSESEFDNNTLTNRALWQSEFADEHFTVLEVKQIIDYAKYLIYKRGEHN
jgi:transcriptional regulator with XRE-family HTH domain